MTHDYDYKAVLHRFDRLTVKQRRAGTFTVTHNDEAAIKSALQLAMDSGWREINEDAKSGATVLVWHEDYDHGAGVSYWSDVYDCFIVGGRKQPTMWAPLTQPPEASDA